MSLGLKSKRGEAEPRWGFFKRPQSIALLFLAVLGLAACSAPGAPTLRKSAEDGGGPLIPDCQNLSPATVVSAYETAFYHSTWSSAFIEGAQEGFRSGLDIENEKDAFVRFQKQFAFTLMKQVFGIDGRHYPFPPYCMKFDAPIAEVAAALDTILPVLDNPIVAGKEAHGLFGTGYFDREHIGAKWRDRYIITARETTTNETVVTVFRDLLISRYGAPYARAESDGHNEAWILTKIGAQVR